MRNDININTGNPIVDQVGRLSLTGNVIPEAWFFTVTNDKGKVDSLAILILSDIVYWYRPSEIRNEDTMEVTFKRKFYDPQDINLLNEARVNLENIIDSICYEYNYYKPRMYRDNARKDYLSLAKCRKRTSKKIRYAIKKQLQYVNTYIYYLITKHALLHGGNSCLLVHHIKDENGNSEEYKYHISYSDAEVATATEELDINKDELVDYTVYKKTSSRWKILNPQKKQTKTQAKL